MNAPWEVTKNPPLADVVRRLRASAEYGARANNFGREHQNWKPEHFQAWHDADAIEAAARSEGRSIMTDVLTRLRQKSWCGPLHIEAADEIDRLRTAASLAFTRLAELNRDDEAGIRMVLANALNIHERG